MTDLFDLAEDLPAPFSDTSIDCRGLPFMPLEIGRLRDSELVAISTGDEFKAAVLLWSKSWIEVPAGSLPDDDRILQNASGYFGAAWKKIKPRALHGWVRCSDGRLYHALISDLAQKASRKRKNTKEAADSRWAAERAKKARKSTKPAAPRNAPENADAQTDALLGRGTVKGESPKAPNAEKPFSPDELAGPANMILADYFEDQRNKVHVRYPSPPEERKAAVWHMAKGVLELYGVSKAAAGKCVGEIVRDFKLDVEDLAAIALRVFDAKPNAARPFFVGCARQFAQERDASARARGEVQTATSEEDRAWQRQVLRSWKDPDVEGYLWPTTDLGSRPGERGCRVDEDIQREFGFTPWAPPSAGEFA